MASDDQHPRSTGHGQESQEAESASVFPAPPLTFGVSKAFIPPDDAGVGATRHPELITIHDPTSPSPPPYDDRPVDPAHGPPVEIVERPQPVAPKRQGLIQKIKASPFLLISIAVHVLLILGAGIWVVQTVTAKRKLTFTAAPPSPNPGQRATEHKVQMAKKQTTMSAPVQSKRIATTGVAKVSLPEMPAMPSMSSMAAPSKMAGMAGASLGFGSAGALGSTGALGGGPVPFFGLRQPAAGGGALEGRFYDLKQDKDGKPTDMAVLPEEETKGASPFDLPPNKIFGEIVEKVVSAGFSEASLKKYFEAPQPLYTTQLFIPRMEADEAPKAFNVADKVKPRRWLLIYRGKVIPPENGRYRFVGLGDDILIVRLNGRQVLDGSLKVARRKDKDNSYQQEGVKEVTPVGSTFEVRAGTAYNLELLLGEWPGGRFTGFLLLEKVGAEYEKDTNGSPKLPIFKLARSEMPKHRSGTGPVVAPDTAWSIWKGETPQRSGGSALDIFRKPGQ